MSTCVLDKVSLLLVNPAYGVLLIGDGTYWWMVLIGDGTYWFERQVRTFANFLGHLCRPHLGHISAKDFRPKSIFMFDVGHKHRGRNYGFTEFRLVGGLAASGFVTSQGPWQET